MDPWEFLEYVGESLVFIGVAGEVFAEWREPHRKWLAKASSIVLVIGLALALVALKETNDDFNGKIADSNLRASQANAAASRDEAEAEKQRDRANKNEKDLLILEHASLPRTIDIERLSGSMEKFPGTTFIMFVLGEYEPGKIAGKISDALNKAHWKQRGADMPVGGGPIPIFEKPGIWIEAAPDEKSGSSRGKKLAHIKMVAKSLMLALKGQGIDAHTRNFSGPTALYVGPNPEDGGVHIFVSLKPMPNESNDVMVRGDGAAPIK